MINLLNVDCMEYMKTVPDKFFELAIVDPPYGIGRDKSQNKNGGKWRFKKYHETDWDNGAPNEAYFIELIRVSKNQVIWGANHFLDNLPFNISSPCWIVWDKINGDGDFADCELAWTSFKSAVRKYSYYFGSENSERIHPTQKPKQLYKWLLKKYAKPGDKILDTHGGSMSIAIACHQMGFDLTLCEIDKDYYDAGVKRFKEQTMQQDLFK